MGKLTERTWNLKYRKERWKRLNDMSNAIGEKHMI